MREETTEEVIVNKTTKYFADDETEWFTAQQALDHEEDLVMHEKYRTQIKNFPVGYVDVMLSNNDEKLIEQRWLYVENHEQAELILRRWRQIEVYYNQESVDRKFAEIPLKEWFIIEVYDHTTLDKKESRCKQFYQYSLYYRDPSYLITSCNRVIKEIRGIRKGIVPTQRPPLTCLFEYESGYAGEEQEGDEIVEEDGKTYIKRVYHRENDLWKSKQ